MFGRPEEWCSESDLGEQWSVSRRQEGLWSSENGNGDTVGSRGSDVKPCFGVGTFGSSNL